MPNPFPDKTKPTAFRESGYVTTDKVPVNDPGPGLSVASVAEGEGVLGDMKAFTGRDVKGVTLHGDNVETATEPEDEVADEVE